LDVMLPQIYKRRSVILTFPVISLYKEKFINSKDKPVKNVILIMFA